jgi:hypothetical protein
MSFVGGAGSGAMGIATISATTGQVTGVTITNGGSGYTSGNLPTVVFASPSGAAGVASLTPTLGYPVITNAGSGCSVSYTAPLRLAILPATYPSVNSDNNLVMDKNTIVGQPSGGIGLLGNLQVDNAGTVNIRSSSAGVLDFKGGPLDAAGNPVISPTSGLDAYIYKMEDDSGDYQRLHIGANAASSVFTFLVEQGGTGAAQGIDFGTTGAGTIAFLTNNMAKLEIDSSGNFITTSLGVGVSQLGTVNSPFFKLCTGNAAGTDTMCDATPTFSGNHTRTWQDSSGTVAWTSQVPTKYSPSLTPAAATTSQCAEQTFTVSGVVSGQQINITPPSSLGAHVWISYARVSASSTVAISFCADATGGMPPSGTYVISAL